MITIQWLGHSCMKINWNGYTVVMDPFEDGSVPGYRRIRETANLVLCSHDHGDHNAAHLVTEKEGGAAPFEVLRLSSWHDDVQGRKRGKNIIHILQGDGVKLVHMGDVGCRPTAEQYELLRRADVAMVPVGGYFTAEPAVIRQIVEEMEARVVIPMHYRRGGAGYDVIGTLDAYTKLCDHVVVYPGDTFTVEKGQEPQTAVLTYPE